MSSSSSFSTVTCVRGNVRNVCVRVFDAPAGEIFVVVFGLIEPDHSLYPQYVEDSGVITRAEVAEALLLDRLG